VEDIERPVRGVIVRDESEVNDGAVESGERVAAEILGDLK
jgi:hypothetical protein